MNKHRGVYERKPGSGIWWIRYSDGADRIRRERVGPKAAAIKLVQKRRTQVLLGKKLPELNRRTVTFGELVEDALRDRPKRSYRNDKVQATRLLGWWKDRPADSLTPGEIEQRLGAQGWANGTFNRYRAFLSFVYRRAVRHGRVQSNPVQLVKARRENSARTGFVNDVQYTALTQAVPPLWMRTLLALGYTYGWRKGELLSLRARQVNLPERTIRLEPGTTKNDEGRMIKLTSECFKLVKACVATKDPAEPVFTREDGSRVRDFSKSWADICVAAGLGRFICRTCKTPGRPCAVCSEAKRRTSYAYQGSIFHDLRRSAVRNLERSGVPRSVAMKITGHRTESVYRRYAIVSEADLAEAADRLERMRLNSQNEVALELTLAPGPQPSPSGKLN